MSKAAVEKSAPDGVRLAVLSNRFEGVVRAMMNTLFRSGRSTVLNTGRDFSCCILSRDDDFVAAAESIPMHVMSGPDIMSAVMKKFQPKLRRGDAFLHNSPYHGNSHAADHCILVPVIDDTGVHRFTVLAKAHMADCGNSVPTTYNETARDVYEEGAPIFPCVKVQQDYEDILDIVRMCEMRIRVPKQWRGDYLAILGAARIGEQRILELGKELGWETLEDYVREWFDYSEQRMIAAISKLPSACFTARGMHDPFPGMPEEGLAVNVTINVRRDEAIIEVDLRDNVDCLPCGLNLTEATARTAAMIGIFNSIGPGVPPNAGSFRRLLIHLRENCAVGIPRHPASCSVATTHLTHVVQNAMQRGMAQLIDGIGMGEFGYLLPPAIGVISGLDPRSGGAPFVNQLILSAVTVGAASPTADGWLTTQSAGNAGVARRDSVEIDELRYPIRIFEQRIIPDSEGAGRFRGAPGAYCEYGPVGTTLKVMYASNGVCNPARGARGGLSGGCTGQYVRRRSGELVDAPRYGSVTLEAGERIISMCGGGGGYGPPNERDPKQVHCDVLEGWISRKRAQGVYGVVLDEGAEIDVEATATLRERMQAETKENSDGEMDCSQASR
jgi:N-methylhydantoinase B